MDEVELKTKLKLKDLINFKYYTIILGTKAGIFIILIPLFMWLAVIYYFSGYAASYESFPTIQLMFALFFTVGLPLVIYYESKSSMNKNTRLKETISYKLSNERIVVTGEQFVENLTWEKVVKFVETKSWFLIYTSDFGADIIRKELLSQAEIQQTRNLIRRIPDLKYSLRN